MELVAIDLEGSGAQDREREAILEIALVPIVDWQPDMTAAYCTLINPERSVPQRPWISPGLTDEAPAPRPVGHGCQRHAPDNAHYAASRRSRGPGSRRRMLWLAARACKESLQPVSRPRVRRGRPLLRP